MRNLLTLFLLISMAVAATAQEKRKIYPVDWKEIEKLATTNPQLVKDLVKRLSADELDSTMTWQERIQAYYGQSYLTPFTDHNEGRTLDELYYAKEYEKCLKASKELLQKNPVSIKALFDAAMSISKMLNDSTHHYDVRLEEGQIYYSRMMRIFNTIASTGYGTAEHPFYVTAVSDEYLFMRHYLNIWKISTQSLTGNCDQFELNEVSEYYTRPDIYFEITRVLELESEMLRSK